MHWFTAKCRARARLGREAVHMRKLMVVAVTVMVGCGARPAYQPSPAAGEFPARVTSREVWLDLTRVPERLRVPSMPLAGGYYVLFASSGEFCVVSSRVWSTGPNDGQVYACRWRTPRGPR